jgi:two-component SAPR family response regulator
MDDNGQVLRILLLGPPLVTYGERPLRVQRRLMRSLLFYLAAQAEPVSRMTLIDLFWPEEDFDQARRHLRETLSKLRGELPQPTILMAEQDYVWLDPIYTYSDVLEFQSLINQVRPYLQRQGNTPLPEAIYQQMYKAIHLWRSPEFLPGANMPSTEDLDHWLTQQTQSLSYQRQSLLEALADHAAVSGDLEEAIYWVKRALEIRRGKPRPALPPHLLAARPGPPR